MGTVTESMSKMATRPPSTINPPPLRHPTVIDDLRLSIVGRTPEKRDGIDHRFAVYGVGLVVGGAGGYRVDGGPRQRVEAGCFFPVYPGPRFTYGPDPGTTWDEYHVCGVGPGTRRWLRCGLLPTDGRVHRVREVEPLVERFEAMLGVWRRGGPGDADRALLMAEALLLELRYGREDQPQHRPHDPRVDRVLEALEADLARPVDFRQLAAEHAMSYSALRKRVRRATGLPPAQYLARLRCEAACRRLLETELSIAEIGREVGVEDPFTFSRLFKRVVGLAPKAYRQQTRQRRRTA